jgi:hypothetical protein
MESNVGVGDILRLFFENEHALYLVSAINYDNEVMIRGRDGVEELLPTDKGKLSELDSRAIVGFQVVRPKTQAFPKGSEVVLNLHNGKSYRGTVQVNDDGILEIMVVDYPTPVFVDVHSPHPMVKNVAFYSESDAAETDSTELPENPETELIDLRSKIKLINPAEAARRTQAFKELRADYTDSASGVVVRPLPLLSAPSPRWIYPVLAHYRKKTLPDAAAQAEFLLELAAAVQQQHYYSYYEAVFQALAPFTSTGSPVKERTHAVSFRQKTVRATKPVYFEVLVPQVVKEGSDRLESGEFVLLPEALGMSRVYLPGTPLYHRCLMHAFLGGFHALIRKKAGGAEVVHSLPTVPQKATICPTAYETFLSLETYLCYLRDVPYEVFERLRPAIAEKVARLKERKARTTSSPSTAATHIFPDKYGDLIPPSFSSEMLAKILAFDHGRRLLNKPVPEPAKKAARQPENSALEVLPEKVLDLFNAWIAETSAASAAKVVALVDTFAREPTKGEDPHWLYMNGDMLKNKFVPVVAERLARAYHHKGFTGYLAALEQLKPSARVTQEGNLLVDKASGFAIAPLDPVARDNGSVIEKETPKLAYTQSDLNILNVVKLVAAPYSLQDRYDYIIQHVRAADRPEDVVYAVGAYVSLFAEVEAEVVARAVADRIAKMFRYQGIYWQAVKEVGPGALSIKMAEKKKYLARDYEFLRMSRMGEFQSGHEWPSFLPLQRPVVAKDPVTVQDKLYLYPLKLIPYFRKSKKEESKEIVDQLQFLEGARPAVRLTATMARPEPPAPKVAVRRFEEEVEDARPPLPPLDPKRYASAAESVWHCSNDGRPPPDYLASLLPENWQSDVKLETLLLAFVQNAALTYPTLISRGRAHFAAHAGLDVQGDRVVAQHLGKKARLFLEKKLNDYYSPLLALSASKSAQHYFQRKAHGEPLGENELSDNDAETAFVRAYEAREEEFRALVKEAQTADLAALKVLATEVLALHLSAPPLDYECAFVGACVKMFRADLNSVKS